MIRDSLGMNIHYYNEERMSIRNRALSPISEPIFDLFFIAHFGGDIIDLIGRLVFLLYVMILKIMGVFIILAVTELLGV